MGDDPYDFDIAIPSGGGGSAGGASDSDDGDGDSAASFSSDSDSASYQPKKKETPVATQRRSSGGGGGGGGGGTSALDKAKSFLSKYSTKATASKAAPSSSGRSRRVEMSLDDEDFSLDSSGEARQKPAKTVNTRKDSSGSEDEGEGGNRSALSRDAFSDEDASASAVDVVAPKATAKVPSARKVEDESRDSDSEDEQPVTKPTRTTIVPTSSRIMTAESSWAGSSNIKKAPVPADDDEVESIASQSDVEDSADARKQTSSYTPRDVAGSVAVSESGVYEDDEFDEASISVSHQATTPIAPAVTVHANEVLSRDEDSHAQYSLDFTDDADVPTANDPPSYIDHQHDNASDDDDAGRRSNASSASDRNKDSFVEENSDEDEALEADQDQGSAFTVEEAPYQRESTQVSTLAEEQSEEEYSQDDRFESESVVNIQAPSQHAGPNVVVGNGMLPQQVASTASKPPVAVEPIQPKTHSALPSPPLIKEHREEVRPRVQIIREYEQERSGVEKRDASTQFTGNHASIQTDLTPDGMVTTADRRRSREPPADVAENRVDTPPDDSGGSKHRSEVRHSEATLPPPPPSLYATYALYDPLQLPAGTSMSTYKQQLLVLQQQIHQKKLETERLFRERISSRYTSLRGTERFLSSNRPPRMPLWEALVRVDPSLGEAKAKEIARMASDGAA